MTKITSTEIHAKEGTDHWFFFSKVCIQAIKHYFEANLYTKYTNPYFCSDQRMIRILYYQPLCGHTKTDVTGTIRKPRSSLMWINLLLL